MIAEFISGYISAFIANVGYFSVFLLMILESMVFPIPSEAIMPFAGFLIAEGKFTFFGVIFFSTLGSLVGSLISYYIGKYGGEKFLHKHGKYFLLNKRELDWTHSFFKKHGSPTIFISRFIPVVRHLISIPAGIAEMNIWKFSFYTVLGAGLWNTFLTVVGFYLKSNWDEILKYSQILDIIILAVLLVGVSYFVYHHFIKHRKINE
ncbi:MAG: DedA family protein [Nanoarchaeota archaeon]|nr:DedA family protein [Nanoarchaeota archaeon]